MKKFRLPRLSLSAEQVSWRAHIPSASKLLFATLGIVVCDLAFRSAPPALAALESDDTGMYGSVTIQRDASAAVQAMKTGDWGKAQECYRKLIVSAPDPEDFYFGLYKASFKLEQWDQVALALEGLFKLKPQYKNEMLLEYGECLYHLNRYDEAEPILKRALASVAKPSPVDQRIKRLILKGTITHTPVVGKIAKPNIKIFKVPTRATVRPEDVSEDTEKALTIGNAFNKSEKIVVATYKGYEASGPVLYYKPPKAIYKIEEFVKGSKLNPTLPVNYEFGNKTVTDKKPDGWKFSEELMPKVGSKWIIFIPNAVPNKDGAFDTFHGSYGRQPYAEKIDELMKIKEQHKGQTD